MNFDRIEQLGERLYFTLDDAAAVLGVGRASARVACSRYVRQGLFVRVKNDFYLLKRNLKNLKQNEFLRLANFVQTPSYVSFLTALSYREVSTQVVRGVCESACIKRSQKVDIDGKLLNFYRLKKELYFGFEKANGIFIATTEKALADSFYLMSLGKYSLDLNALDIARIDMVKLHKIIKVFPAKTKVLVKALCKI